MKKQILPTTEVHEKDKHLKVKPSLLSRIEKAGQLVSAESREFYLLLFFFFFLMWEQWQNVGFPSFLWPVTPFKRPLICSRQRK